MKLQNLAIIMTIAVPFSSVAVAAKLDTDQKKFSYAIGAQIGSSVKREGLDLDLKAMTDAITDVVKGNKLQMTPQDMQAAVQSMQQKQAAVRAKQGEGAKKAGADFLAANKAKKDIITLANGIQYKVLKEGTGPKPTATSTVVANYSGTLINGTEFDSSYKRGEPASFPVSGVIKGWQEILPLMATGSKWQVFIPAELAYADHGAGPSIGPWETLIFEIELLEVK